MKRLNGINIVGTLLIICVALVVFYAIGNMDNPIGEGFSWGWEDDDSDEHGWLQNESQEEYFQSDVREVRVETISGDIEVLQWDGSDIKIEYQIVSFGGFRNRSIEVQLQQQGDRITAKRASGGPWSLARSGSVHFRVFLPRGIDLEEMKLKTVSGSIDVAEMDAIQEISAESVSGSVSIESGEIVKISTISGRIYGYFESLEEFRGDSTSGRIEIHVENPHRDMEFRADSVSGSITLYCEDFEGDVFMDSVSGSMKTDQELIVESSDRTTLRGRIGRGDMSFNADTVSGSILLGM